MGVWPTQYFHTPHSDNSLEQIWDDIDNWSFEDDYNREDHHNAIYMIVPFPPMELNGKFLKGMFFSQACDTLLAKFPNLKKMFNVVAHTMFSSYSHCDGADICFACYKNEAREQYFRKKYPHKSHIALVPLQPADYTNEYYIGPTLNTPKKIDVICISTAYPVKNLPMLAKALKAYESKYNKILKCTVAIGNRDAVKLEDGTMDYSKVRWDAKAELEEIDEILINTEKYIDFHPYIEYKDIARYYSSSRCAVLTSLMEGKNRFINEAMSCNVPVVVFKDHNKYARGDYPVFFGNSGEYAPEFTPESLADTIHKVLTNQDKYEPRKNYLMHSGRRNFVNTLVNALPYYKENIPDYSEEGGVQNNLWIDMAVQASYGISFHDFLYDKKTNLTWVTGLDRISDAIDYYTSLFGKYI